MCYTVRVGEKKRGVNGMSVDAYSSDGRGGVRCLLVCGMSDDVCSE